MNSIYSFVREKRDNYNGDILTIVDGYEYNQANILRRVELYYNSLFETGNKDSLKRDKPFYNIVKSRVNLATRATDIDVKDIQVESEVSEDYARSFLFRKEIQQWMKNTGLATLLNKIGKNRNKFGGVVVKKN